jgi:uncharacterized protein (TIGR00375 family)
VKITGAKNLTLTNILIEASEYKGLDLIGVIDCHVPEVQQEIEELIERGQARELTDGGIRFQTVTCIMGSEIEIYDDNCKGPIHVLCFFPALPHIRAFTSWLTGKMTNIHLSSQRYYGSAKELQHKVKELGGVFIPAHVFTPFKSLYGKGVERSLAEVLDEELIDGIELGLSSDTAMASGISELDSFPFLSNSDAHSLGKIAREYQEVRMKTPSFREFVSALKETDGREITRNFGMNPLLGKYYHTVCKNCLHPLENQEVCSRCHSHKFIRGVKDRIEELSSNSNPKQLPPYIHQVPLDFIPGLGPKTFQKLLGAFGTEMNIIHQTEKEDLLAVVPEKLADAIIANREGRLSIQAGGGGRYGRIHPM